MQIRFFLFVFNTFLPSIPNPTDEQRCPSSTITMDPCTEQLFVTEDDEMDLSYNCSDIPNPNIEWKTPQEHNSKREMASERKEASEDLHTR